MNMRAAAPAFRPRPDGRYSMTFATRVGFVVTAIFIAFSIWFSTHLVSDASRDTSQGNCEQRAASIISARKDYRESLDRLNRPSASLPPEIVAKYGDLLAAVAPRFAQSSADQRAFYTKRLATVHPIACVDGNTRELPIPKAR